MGCDSYGIRFNHYSNGNSGTFVSEDVAWIWTESDTFACLCTFPFNDARDLDKGTISAGRLYGLAMIGAAVIAVRDGVHEQSPSYGIEQIVPDRIQKAIAAKLKLLAV